MLQKKKAIVIFLWIFILDVQYMLDRRLFESWSYHAAT